MPETPLLIAQVFELTLAVVGGVLIWRHVLRPEARARGGESPRPPGEAPPSDFFVFAVATLCGYFFLGLAATMGARSFGLRGDAVTVVGGAGGQLGMLLGVASYRASYRRSLPAPVTAPGPNVVSAGVATFLMTMPVIMVTSAVWEFLLKSLGLPVSKQDSIEIFIRGESPWLVLTMIVLATLAAPLTEELVFRAGFVRYFRTRMSRPVAYLVPAVVFAALHVNWDNLVGLASFLPLVMLAVVFSIAYERTGRIGTTIVAHALFNLNAIFLIFAGAGQDS